MNSKNYNSDDLQDELEEKEIDGIAAGFAVSDKMWNTDIIWREITSFLNISDLKEFSLVNRFFLQRVRSLTRFSSLAAQVVRGNMEIHVFQLSRAIVEVNTIKEIVLKKRAARTFKNTEYLEIQCLNGLSIEVLNARLIHIVSNCPKLKSLAFFVGGILSLDAFFTNPNVKIVLSNLKELYLDVKRREWRDSEWNKLYGKEGSRELQMFKSQFPDDLQMKLTTFSCNDFGWFHCTSLSPAVFLTSSQNSLVKLNLHIPFNNSSLADLDLKCLKTLIFPKLKELTLTVNADKKSFATHVLSFFQNHFSFLRKFTFCNGDVISLEPFCEMLKTSTKIETFVLRSTYDLFQPLPSQIDWKFLKKLTTLRRFELIAWSTINYYFSTDNTRTCENFARYLDVLPPMIESLEFQPPQFSETALRYHKWDITTTELAFTLLHFDKLTTLKLSSPVSDEFLQLICKNLTNLLMFKVNLAVATDFGIGGVAEDENNNAGMSLANLKGLRKFHIAQTFNKEPLLITWDGLIRSIRFLDLVELIVESPLNSDKQIQKFGGNETLAREIDEHKFLALVSKMNNPCLEKVNFKYYQPTHYVYREMKIVNPRIKSCIFCGSSRNL